MNCRFTPWKTALVLTIGWVFGVLSSNTALFAALAATFGFGLWDQ